MERQRHRRQLSLLAVIASAIACIATASASSVPVVLTPAFSITGISANHVPITGGGLDRFNHTYSSTLLNPSLPWSSGSFRLGAPASADAVSSKRITLPAGAYTAIELLATGVNGSQPRQPFTLTYTNGVSVTITQSLSDWHAPKAFVGEAVASTQAYRLTPDGSPQTGPYYLYGYAIAVNPLATLQSITLPNNPNVVVLAMNLVPTGAPPLAVDLTNVANTTGISAYHVGLTADTTRSYAFSGTVAAGTVDRVGAFGPPGATIGNLPFLAVTSIDLTTSTFGPGNIGGDTIRTAPTLSQRMTVNGVTRDDGGAEMTAHHVADAYFEFFGGAYEYYASLDGATSFPDFDSPGVYQLDCVGSECTFLITYTFDGGSGFGPTLHTLTVGDSALPLPLNAPGDGLDTYGNAYDSALLNLSIAAGGVPFLLLPPSVPNAVANADIALPVGAYSTLNILGTAVRGNQPNAKITVHYQDGSSTVVTQSFSDWHTPQHYPREITAAQMPSRLKYNGTSIAGPFYLYAYSLPLNPAKHVRSVSLPATRSVVAFGITLAR